ncbi:MAG: cation diffusion facilitator family transporter [Betaproteobacteria bacterium]
MDGSKLAVYGAIGANVAIAATKFAVAGVTGSSAMLAEGIHSAVDTGNGILLLVGMKLSQREATAEHPFGHGKEIYFWSLIVAVLIFGLGGGISAYQGLLHVLHPQQMGDPLWNYVVLAAAALFEGISFGIALRTFLREKGTQPFWQALHESKDPTTYTVLAEDSAALAGLAVAAVGIYLGHRLDLPVLDGVASIVIGFLLAGVAVLLIRESRGLLIGEGVRPATAEGIQRIALSHPCVHLVGRPLSMYIGPEDVLLTLDVEFDRDASAEQVAESIYGIEQEIRATYSKIKRIYIEAGSIGARARPDKKVPTLP